MTVAAPELHVGALRIEDVPEGRVTRVARTRQHREPAPDLARKQNPVAVIGKKCVFKLVERLEVIRPRNADRRPVVAVAPRNVVFVADLRNARIVAVDPLADLASAPSSRKSDSSISHRRPSTEKLRGCASGGSCRRTGKRPHSYIFLF